jgi:hypothetical protein
MKRNFILMALLMLGGGLFAQDKPKETPKPQFILIIRSKTDYSNISKDVIKTNITHWQAYMGNLAQAGKIVSGYRPGADGVTIGADKNTNNSPYRANSEIVSSFLVINAANMDEAKSIAQKCPVFELGGSIEVRPVINVAQ